VKKIFGILVALSLVLSLLVMATPVAAKVVNVVVKVDGNCATQIGVYNITFNTSASLTQGVHSVCIKFPAGTTIQNTGSPLPWGNGDIKMNGIDVFGSEVTVTGTTVCFKTPVSFNAGKQEVLFTFDACIINPATPGFYQLEVYTDRTPDTTPVKNLVPYYIAPCFSTYVFGWDSSPSFPGIATDFVPPFKACGQNLSTAINIGTVDAPKYAEAFKLAFGTLANSLIGCEAPCGKVKIYYQLTASPQVPCGRPAATVYLNLTTNTTMYPCAKNLTANVTWEPCLDADGIPYKYVIAENCTLAKNTVIGWDGYIHFNMPGEYTICFTAECTGGFPACTPPNCDEGNILTQRCITFEVHQMKDAAKIELWDKWNLISLPLVPFDTDICSMLASVDTFDYWTFYDADMLVSQDNLMSVWNYDAATEDWLVYGNGQDSLTTIEDGKAYWFRMRYPLSPHAKGPPQECGNYSWWVFGTQLPEPPDGPRVYSVEQGWNMVGFTSLTAMAPNVYLKNWDAMTIPVPVIMGWTQGCFLTGAQAWKTVAFNATNGLVPGQGYWMAFAQPGFIYQNVP